jgi:hypothetical protein
MAGLKAGTALTATYEDGSIRIERDIPGPKVESRSGRRIARPAVKDAPAVDVAARIEEERDRWPG